MTALAEQEIEVAEKTSPRLLLATFFLVAIVVPIVCHGCHAGDHDDELSVPLLKEKTDHG